MASALFAGALLSPYVLKIHPVEAQEPPAVAPVVRAQRLELVDQQGRRKALLFTSSTSEPRLFLYDNRDRVRLSLSVIDGEAAVDLCDSAGVPRSSLVLQNDGPALLMADHRSTPRLRMACTEEEGPVITLQDLNKKPRLNLMLQERFGPSIRMDDSEQTTRLNLTCDDEAGPAIALSDKKERIIRRLP